MKTRIAIHADFPELALLMGELGYPTSLDEMTFRMSALAKLDNYEAFVAVEAESVAGMIGLSITPSFYRSDLAGAIVALVVSPHFRGRGVAALLVACGERWFAERGVDRVSVNPSNHRTSAHRVYNRLGYEQTGLRFTKTLKGI
ncbi:GNAT family N-acetyltransferase [Agrobacterium rosae]|uniref:GNAT family N-acetyltransferase n=1 Tax=Agrobacterium rosae TaxID=1972867 RepID=UPI0019D33A8E|nr:GNAT family N-acetyltransferase [Agrobacterium rosae]MBN7804836.1 GNAT family N-acetyltransferase [Agrobacterium rosae]